MNILSVENLGVRYEQSIALDGVTFSVEQGDFVGIAGPNGAGKTTLIKAIFGLIPSFSGAVSLFGEAQKKFAKWQSIGYLPQKNVSVNPLFPAVVEEVVLLGLISEKSFPKKVTKADKKAVREILEELGIGDLRKKSFTELSGDSIRGCFWHGPSYKNQSFLSLMNHRPLSIRSHEMASSNCSSN